MEYYDDNTALYADDEQNSGKKPGQANQKSGLRRYAIYGIVLIACILMIMGFAIQRDTETKVKSLVADGSPTPTHGNPASTDSSAHNTGTPKRTSYGSPSKTGAPTPTVKPKRGTIIVDAGHGGFDPGTQGLETGIYEKDINLAIARFVETLLIEANYDVIMTREDEDAIADTKEKDMEKRQEIIAENMETADMVISIHQDAFPSDRSVRGPAVYYSSENESGDGKVLATFIQDALNNVLKIERPRQIRAAADIITRQMPASVLVECGFLTNERDEEKLSDPEYQEQIAKAIVFGVNKYFTSIGK